MTPRHGLLRIVLPLVLRASSMHIGGTATQAWLRSALVDAGHLPADDFNRCFAVARLTPGTNLLAFYTALGYRVAEWRGALACLSVSTLVPAVMAAVLGILYVRFLTTPGVSPFMAGAQAGAVAVLFWTAMRLLVSTARERLGSGVAVTVVATVATWSGLVPPIVILLGAAAIGAVLLRDQP